MRPLGMSLPLLGQIDLRPSTSTSKLPTLLLPDLLLILGVGLGLMLILLLWVVFVRKRKAPRSSGRITYRTGVIEEGDAPKDDSGHGRHHHRRHRRQRRDHRERNPTLAETGGLPPLREDESHGPTPKS